MTVTVPTLRSGRDLRTLAVPPPLPGRYLQSVLTARGRRGGPARALPDAVLALPGAGADHARVAAYARVCGFRFGDALPPTYPHVLGFPLQLALMTDPAFPFALPGLVHVRNVIDVRAPLRLGDRITLQAYAEGLAPHPKGAQVDLVVDAFLDDVPVWSGRSTYLARGAEASGAAYPPAVPAAAVPARTVARLPVRADAGRRYAAVSGDVNPIHLHPLAARLFGLRRAVAHGMWTAARSLAALEGRLPDAYRYDVAFRKAVPLPSTVALHAAPAAGSAGSAGPAGSAGSGGWDLGLTSPDGSRVHLAGTVRPA